MASNQSTEGESKPMDQQIFKTKLVDYDGFQLRIVAQDEDGPCPLIAVCNVLLLKQKFHLVSLTVSADTLLKHVADQLCQGAASLAGDRNQDLSQALKALPRLRTGIDVNFRFNKIDGFVDMPELAIFRLLKIPLYHGWMVDPQDSDTAKAFGSKPYNRIIKEVADFRAWKGKGDLEEQEALTETLTLSGCSLHLDKAGHHSAHDATAILGPSGSTSVNSSMDVRGPVDEREVVVAKQVERGCDYDSDKDLSPFIIRARGLLIDAFLENNKNQLTIYGLVTLQEGLADGELCVFFCSNHFNTMTKYKNELYVLVTDQGYVSQPDLVWGKLNEVNGDTVFVTGDFKVIRQEAWIKDSWDEQKTLTGTNDYLASSKSSVLSDDEKLPAEFQREKYKSELQQRPTSRVTTGLQAYKEQLVEEEEQIVDEQLVEEHPVEKQIVNPWKVEGGVDYDKLINRFGCQRIDKSLIERVERLTSRPAHVFLRRNVFFAHRGLSVILDAYENGDKFYLYTGRGLSSEVLHLGDLIPFLFTKYLQDTFKVPLVIQLDDEKCIWKNLSVEETKRLARENAKDIIACGFDITRTFIFSNFDYVGGAFYQNEIQISKNITGNQLRGIYGITLEDSVAKISFPAKQAAPCFASSFPHLFTTKDSLRCLIPCAIDQDPYFRMARDVASKIGYPKPALIESSFFPALQGDTGKVSASDPNSAIYITDSADDILYKISRHAFSGGQKSAKLHKQYGANLETDISFKYLTFFLDDDAELEHIAKEYGSGNMLTSEIKKRVTEVLIQLVEKHRKARAAVTDSMVDAFMAVRPLPNMFD